MKLKIKFLKWQVGVPTVMLNRVTANKIGVPVRGLVSLQTSKISKPLSALVDIVENMIKRNEIAVSVEVKKRLNLKRKQKLLVSLSDPPASLKLIKKKLDKKDLTAKEFDEIIKEVVDNSLSGPEIALFISAMHKQGMSIQETVYLIKAILKTGDKLSFKNKLVVDKHSIGGIPGNRTTPIIVSICAAAGLLMPKNSSRAITSAAGTADIIETIAKIEFTMPELKKIIKKTNACMVWGGSLGIVPADSKIILIEKELKLDPEAQLLASIMSKKLASDSDYIVIDIPYGKTAKVDKKKALRLKKKFEKLGKYFHKDLKVVLTNGSQPIGNGIGPELELRDVMRVLKQEKEAPKDLELKSIFLAGQLLEMAGKAKQGGGMSMAKSILASGKAFKKFEEIIKAQKGKLRPMKKAKFKKDILVTKSGQIKEMDNKKINSLARIAGCPVYKPAGLYLYFHVGEKVKKKDKLLTIYSQSKSRLKQAVSFYNKQKPIKIRHHN
jgi:putative thymidine phosphorylase